MMKKILKQITLENPKTQNVFGFFRRDFLWRRKSGFAMMLLAVIFTALTLVIALGLATPIIKQVLISSDIWSEKQSYYLSEAGAEDVLYRLKSASYNQYVTAAEPITLNNYSATTTTSGTLDSVNGMTITTLSNQSGYDKKIQTVVKESTGVSFVYGMQAGQGGFTLSGSSKIIGNVYSAGPIVGCTSCSISGSAIVSDGPDMTLNQSNTVPTSPPDSITFENTASTQDVAQSFQVSSTSPITQLSLYMEKKGSPGNITVEIVNDNNGLPGSTVLASATLASTSVATSFGWIDIAFPTNPSLTPSTSYWIVLNGGTGDASDDYVIGANLDTSYPLGTSKSGVFGGSWSNTGYDTYFKVYLGGFFGSISGASEYDPMSIGTTNTDIVWAHNVSYITATGPIQCQNGIYNSAACNQSYSDPSSASYPVSTTDISGWESEATAGGTYSGNYSQTGSGTFSLGPQEINGNLTIGGSVTLNVTGTLYVTGNLIIEGSGIVKLASSYGSNSGIIVVNGTVAIEGSGVANGSGQTGSYIMLISNSTCPTGSTCGGNNAITISGSAGSVILNAEEGTASLSGSAAANEVTASSTVLSGSATVTYQTGIANANFSTGPTGGFTISSWKELSQ